MVASFVNQIKSEYYVGNISVAIEGISLEQYKKFQQNQIGLEPVKPTSHAMFLLFLSDENKHGSATTAVQIKRMGLLKK